MKIAPLGNEFSRIRGGCVVGFSPTLRSRNADVRVALYSPFRSPVVPRLNRWNAVPADYIDGDLRVWSWSSKFQNMGIVEGKAPDQHLEIHTSPKGLIYKIISFRVSVIPTPSERVFNLMNYKFMIFIAKWAYFFIDPYNGRSKS